MNNNLLKTKTYNQNDNQISTSVDTTRDRVDQTLEGRRRILHTEGHDFILI